MRKYIFYIALLMVGCASNGDDGSTDPRTDPPPVAHVPVLSSIALLPESAVYMEGDGSVVTTVDITFRDDGSDLKALRVRMPDDSIIEFPEAISSETGTFSEELSVSTNTLGALSLTFWLVDQAGYNSVPVTADFLVIAGPQSSDWTSRVSGLPNALGDVIWDGDAFIAVGAAGTVLTSSDGIDWVSRQSGTAADLNAVASYGSEIVAVGDEIVLLSTDHGSSWMVKGTPAEAILEAVAITSSQVVIGGYRWGWATAVTLVSEDRGDTWQPVDSWPNENLHMNDLVYENGLFVASTPSYEGLEAWVTVSSDGKVWNEIAVSEEGEWAVPHTIIHDGSRFILAGLDGTVFTSPDGFNWARLPTPVRQVFYTGAAWSGSKLVLAGASMCGGMWLFVEPFDVPLGLSSTDGGMTWDLLDIDDNYESSDLAWGNGRFVSVGVRPEPNWEGAIYTGN